MAFQLVDLDAAQSELIINVIQYFQENAIVTIKDTTYAFQKGANQVLILQKRE